MSSRLDETDHPEYKIYRKTPIRLSMLQRIRNIISEEQRRFYPKHPVQKQGSKTGEKLANPDYVDPHTLFTNSRQNSQASLSLDSGVASGNFDDDIMGERVQLDMTLNEKDVFREIEERMSENVRNSPSDSYYESILENSLTEEYETDQVTGKLVIKSDSFTNNDRIAVTMSGNAARQARPNVVRRPTKAPPPIPAKPLRLTKCCAQNRNEPMKAEQMMKKSGNDGQTSWVRAMVGRFE